MRTSPLVLLLASAVMLPALSHSAVTFQFSYDGTGGNLWSNDAKNALNIAANNMAGYFSAYTATIDIQVSGSNVNNQTLASAGSEYASITNGFGNLGVVGTKILTNGASDLNSSAFDGTVDANFFHAWSFNDTVNSSQYDFVSTMMHEIGHALGFLSGLDSSGVSFLGPNAYTPFDQFLVDGGGTTMVTGSLTTSPNWATASIGGTGNGLYFNGTNAVAANGGNPVAIYSPTTWSQGSSASHLDDDFFTGGNAKLMNSASPTGFGIRTLSDIEIGIFRDLGYTQIAAVPEPTRGVLILFAVSCLVMRRRRTV